MDDTAIENTKTAVTPRKRGLFSLVKEYKGLMSLLTLLTVIRSALNLVIPLIISRAIDSYTNHTFDLTRVILEFSAIAVGILIFSGIQMTLRTYLGEKIALDIRTKLSTKISHQSYAYIEKVTSAKLLTNLTSDVTSVKSFAGMGFATIVSSIFLIIGASISLFLLNWKLALAVLTIIPAIGGTFYFVFGKMRGLFKRSREIIDWLNKVINESILGAALVRVLDSEKDEKRKFGDASRAAQENGIGLANLFAILIPSITLIASLAGVIVLLLGGHFVIVGGLTIGEFAAFNSYIGILIFPILSIGFMSNFFVRASVSYGRIEEVLHVPEEKIGGDLKAKLSGKISVKNIVLKLGDHEVLKNISFEIEPRSKTAIIGPTAAGKSQLLHLLVGLIDPTEGEILFDGRSIKEYDPTSLHESIGFVFQDSIMFNMSLRENVAFNQKVSENEMKKAIEAAELDDFVKNLPKGLETDVSERGLNLSGGQKQRVMLARALALRPSILLLDDFTARVDNLTEQKILKNIETLYPDLTLISVTQKIASIKNYDKIILLMEGEKLAEGTHEGLLTSSPEYMQIFHSQKSVNHS